MEEWSERDRVLAEALIEFEATAHCPGCGQLKSEAWSEDTAGSWEQKHVHCFACEASAEAQKQQEAPEPGQLAHLALNRADVERARQRREFLEANPDFNPLADL